jgi:ATP-dependent RNA helicase DeaD
VYLHRIGRTGRAGREGVAITLAEPREHRLLRVIENFTRTKIEVATVPTVADLRARQLDITRATLRESLVARDFDNVRVVVESLAEEFDIVDIAAAAVKMAHATIADGSEKDMREIPAPAPFSSGPREGSRFREGGGSSRFREGPSRPRERSGRPHEEASAADQGTSMRETRAPRRWQVGKGDRPIAADAPTIRLYVGAGRQAGIRPGDLVGAITGEAGIESRLLGAIQIGDRSSYVEVPETLADDIVSALKATTIRGKKVSVRRDLKS